MILNNVSKTYRQKDFDYALVNCLRSYLHLIVEESMERYAKVKIKRELNKVIKEMQKRKIEITKELKKHKTENYESAFLFGEQKQIDYFMDWLQKIVDPKLLDE